MSGIVGYTPIMLKQMEDIRLMVEKNKTEKPPSQGVGVQGFKADLYANNEVKIKWETLIHLPKFQMYVLETSGGLYGTHSNVMEWIKGCVQDLIGSNGEKKVFEQYGEWHNKKDYWNNETVYGELLGGE